MVEVNIWSYRKITKNRAAFGYAITDLNKDGNDELVLLLQDYTVLAIFTLENGKPKLVDAFWPRYRCAILDSGMLYIAASGGACDWFNAIQRIAEDGSKLIRVEEYGSTSKGGPQNYYKVIDGENKIISKSEFDQFRQKYPVLSDETAKEITKNSGIKFLPLFN